MTLRVPLLVWDGPIKGYAVNFLNTQFWRIAYEYENVDEALQDAYLIFHRIRQRYRGVVKSEPHFMALFQTALSNHVINLSRKLMHRRNLLYESSLLDTEGGSSLPEMEVLDEKSFRDIIEGTKDEEVRAVLSFFVDAPEHLLCRMSTAWEASGKMKMHGDGFLREALDVTKGVSERTRNYLRGLEDESGT